MKIETAKYLRWFAIGIYSISLLLPAYLTREPHMQQIGLMLLLFGWVTLFQSITSWLANPLIFFCFYFMQSKPYLCTILAGIAILLAHDFYKVESMGWDSSYEIYQGEVIGINIGCYLWLSSLVLTLLASILYLLASRRAAQNIT